MTESIHTKKVRALQAVKNLRLFYDEVFDPVCRAKAKSVPEHPKYLLSVARHLAQADKFLEAIQTIQGELESFKCAE